MRILGISNGDVAGACVIRDGLVTAAASEERFAREKNLSCWPARALEYVLQQEGVTLDGLDAVAYGYGGGFSQDKHLRLYLERFVEEASVSQTGVNVLYERVEREVHNDAVRVSEFRDWVQENRVRDRVSLIDHHEAHGLGAFECSGFSEALVVTCDGRGDFQSLTVSAVNRDEVRVLQRETSADSLGFFYGRIAALLGFRANDQEGKVTGLAAHGDPGPARALIERMIAFKDGHVRGQFGDYFQPKYDGYSKRLLAEVARFQPEDIAAAAQEHLESILKSVVRRWMAHVGSTNLCLSGGVFANVRLNQVLAELPGVKQTYVLPPMGDVGLPLQAAAVESRRRGARLFSPVHMDLGPDADADADTLLDTCIANGYKVHFDEVEHRMIDLFARGMVIGTYRGRMEFGPRALCNRSILCRTGDKSLTMALNDRLKRSDFMPFGPVIAQGVADKALKGWSKDDISSRFMTITYRCSDRFREVSPAVVHVDGTARPQVVNEAQDPFMHSLLMRWYGRSGELGLVNTSFNAHEEPIACSGRDAFRGLRDDRVDVLLVCNRALVVGPNVQEFL